MTGRGVGSDRMGACPAWCELDDEEHGDDPYDPGVRTHAHQLSEHVQLTLVEDVAANPPNAPSVYVCVDPDDMTAAQVRMLAAELLNAADELDELHEGHAG